jgi:hypothetical protein
MGFEDSLGLMMPPLGIFWWRYVKKNLLINNIPFNKK